MDINTVITTAIGERSFSILQKLKTYLRNITRQPRINGIVTLIIHTDTDIEKLNHKQCTTKCHAILHEELIFDYK